MGIFPESINRHAVIHGRIESHESCSYYGKHDLRSRRMAEPPQPFHGKVVVAPTFCGNGGTNLHEFESEPIFTPKTPNAYSGALLLQILGHEFAGRVVTVPDAKAGQCGDRRR